VVDKTGTLTVNQLTAREIVFPDGGSATFSPETGIWESHAHTAADRNAISGSEQRFEAKFRDGSGQRLAYRDEALKEIVVSFPGGSYSVRYPQET